MTYAEALAYLNAFVDYEKLSGYVYDAARFNLARPRRLLHALGDPHTAFPSIHIAGTKGKSSTAALTESVLRAARFRTGLFISPHLTTFRERIQVAGEPIPEADLARLVTETQPVIDAEIEHPEEGRLSFFEVYFALACRYFADTRRDVAVFETGLGGRLDGTNVLQPVVCGITAIGFDHMRELGDTLAKIAGEKAAIIKPRTPVLAARQGRDALKVISQTAREREAEFGLVTVEGAPIPDETNGAQPPDWEVQVKPGKGDLRGQSFTVEMGRLLPVGRGGREGTRARVSSRTQWQSVRRYPHLWIPLVGRHQLANAGMAVGLVDVFRERRGRDVRSEEWIEALYAGLGKVQWHGRFEVFETEPFVILDCAHTRESAEALRETLQELVKHDRLVLILGVLADKNLRAIAEVLCPIAATVILAPPDNPRAESPAAMRAKVADLCADAVEAPTVTTALALARTLAGKADAILVTGGVYTVGEVLRGAAGRPLASE
jgi:dihydrofolate synthase/folylpolyglutamate synthase